MAIRRLTFLLASLAACSGTERTPDTPPWGSHFALVSVDGRSVPTPDSLALEHILSGAIELYRPDSLRIIRITRDVFMDRIPCEALRALAQTEATAGIGAVSDTTTTGCDELREAEADTQLLAYDRRGDELRVPDATLRLRGDTLVFEDTVGHEEVDGPMRTQTRTWRYVRVPTSAP
jgi:hypothetical protein